MSLISSVTKLLGNTISMTAGTVVGSQTALRWQVHRQPYPMPQQVAAVLDHPLRFRYRGVSDTLALFGITSGLTVLDLGCGTGVFTIPAARMVGENGKVIAVDIQMPLLEEVRRRTIEAGVAERCAFHHAGAYRLPLENQSVDVALCIATLGEVPDRLHALLELYRVIKPGGRLAISEELPDPAYLPAGAVRQYGEEAGFSFAGKTGSPFVYQMVFTRP
jgi:ubiquinone/menaquinone biosynthesis C-methylase UbiE